MARDETNESAPSTRIRDQHYYTAQLLAKNRTSRNKKKVKRLGVASSGSDTNKKKSKNTTALLRHMNPPKTPKGCLGIVIL